METSTVRVRFAPSPTGYLHIGGLRTALFNWLFAQHHKGVFLIRIEDTDIERSKKEYVDAILQALDWVSITSDGPIVYQSDFIEEHKKLINRLIKEGKAYKCYCPPSAYDKSEYVLYPGKCREGETDQNKPFIVRFKVPRDQQTISFDDLIRGTITFNIDQFDDFIVARSDGTPVYNFVVVADDIEMNITQVIRGEDHISNTPKQIMLYQALGFSLPQFAHLPLILGPTGARLSKREAATSVLDYRTQGYLADALCNYLVRLGWAHGDQEIFSRQELIDIFTLKEVGKKGAVFDIQKLQWLNGVYIRQTTAQELLGFIERDVDYQFIDNVSEWSRNQLLGLIDLYKDRVKTLKELVNELKNLYEPLHEVSQEDRKQWITNKTTDYVQHVIKVLDITPVFDAETLKVAIKALCKELTIKLSVIAQPIRLALTGTTNSPGIFELLSLLGKEGSISRLEHFVTRLKEK